MNEASYVVATLEWCNERRAEKGMEPLDKLPKGKRWQSQSCPCGKATGLSVGLDTYSEIDSKQPEDDKELPEEVSTFVHLFDEGFLPEYDENPEWKKEWLG